VCITGHACLRIGNVCPTKQGQWCMVLGNSTALTTHSLTLSLHSLDKNTYLQKRLVSYPPRPHTEIPPHAHSHLHNSMHHTNSRMTELRNSACSTTASQNHARKVTGRAFLPPTRPPSLPASLSFSVRCATSISTSPLFCTPPYSREVMLFVSVVY
jgi:hypothetical protein